MFLNELNKNEAIAFLNLVDIFSKVDNVLANEEKELIEDYKEELEIKSEEISNISYDEVIASLKESNDRNKRIVYFELVGLALVDGEYEEKEVDFLDKLAVDLNIPRDKRIAFANFFFNFKEVYDFSVVESDNKIQLLQESAEALL
ncbi:MAG: hypothetical protein ACRC7N_03385 [Clostridium sp.]